MSTDQELVTLKLPERLDRSATVKLKEELDSAQGQGVVLDGGENEAISGLGIQLICKAKSHWETSGWSFDISQPSDKLSEALSWLGHDQISQTEGF